MKARYIAVWVGCFMVVSAVADSAGTINGYPVSDQEYRFFLEQEKPMVISYFIRTHNAIQSPSFWETACGGEVPATVLTDRVIRKIIRTRVIQELGIEYGVCRQVKSYDDFMVELQKVNAQRRQWVAEGRVIYGPVQYSSDFYFEMNLDQIFSETAKKLSRVSGPDRWISDEAAAVYYQEHPERAFPFDEVKSGIIRKLTDARLAQLVQERIERAKVAGFAAFR